MALSLKSESGSLLSPCVYVVASILSNALRCHHLADLHAKRLLKNLPRTFANKSHKKMAKIIGANHGMQCSS